MINFLKKLELDRIKESSYISFYGCFMQQNSNAVLSINRLLDAVCFSNIIELGTLNGGLSTLLALYCFLSKRKVDDSTDRNLANFVNCQYQKIEKNFHTFDCREVDKNNIEFLKSLGANFEIVDFLNNSNDINKIGSIIKSPGRTLVLCDGGDKVKEIKIYSKYLKSGDVIMAHDYAKDSEKLAENIKRNIWHHKEIDMKDIEDSLRENSILQFLPDEFDDAAWFCGVKA